MTIERHTLAMIFGLMSILLWPTIPSYWIGGALLLLGVMLCKTNTKTASFIVGLSICILSINYQFSDLKYLLSANSSIKGTIVSLPQQGITDNRFYFDLSHLSNGQISKKSASTMLLNWSGQHDLAQGQRWQFIIKAKPIIGLFNQGGFNYQRYLISNDVIARGSIISGKMLDSQPDQRGSLAKKLDELLNKHPNKRFIKALMIGDKRRFTSLDWQLMKQTGTSHLFAISGLHLSLIALFIALISAPFFKLIRLPRHLAQCFTLMSVVCASAYYCYLAGFSLPTVRALTMVVLISIFSLWNHRLKFSQLLLLTLVTIGIYNPLSLLSQGLWLSLFAVCIVYLMLTAINVDSTDQLSLFPRIKHWIYQLIKLQLCLALGLYFIQLIFFGGISLLAPLANLIAVPVITLLVLPMLFLALCSLLLEAMDIAQLLFYFSDNLLECLFYTLNKLTMVDGFWLSGSSSLIVGAVIVTFVGLGAAQLFYVVKRKMLMIWGGVLTISIITGMMWPNDPKHWRVDFLDVGHGNSAIIKQGSRAIIVDTGNIFGQDSTIAQTVIQPFLEHQKIVDVDYIFITHQDKDHSAGLSFLQSNYPNARVITNNEDQCRDITRHWGSLVIKTVMAKGLIKKSERSENNRSCLIHFNNQYGSVLFTGDIERAAEQKLVKQLDSSWQAQVMQIPHHGSKTSSSKAFVNLIKPKVAIVSARSFNQWNFPIPIVLKRYGNMQTQVYDTSTEGQITVEFTSQGRFTTSYRRQRAPFWYNRDLSFGHYKR